MTNEFMGFWERYPRRIGKLVAAQKYAQARKLATADEILDGVDRYIANKPEYQDWAHPKTWLSQGRWMDEYQGRAAGRPHVEGRKDCRHEPKCPSNEWHQVLLARAQRQVGAA